MKQSRSKFVSILGWILMIISGIGFVKATSNSFLFFNFFPSGFVKHFSFDFHDFRDFPLLAHFKIMTICASLFFAGTFVISLFFLKHKEWARKAIIVIFLLLAAGLISSTLMMWFSSSFFSKLIIRPENGFIFNFFVMSLKYFITLIHATLLILTIWLIYKCSTAAVRKYFSL